MGRGQLSWTAGGRGRGKRRPRRGRRRERRGRAPRRGRGRAPGAREARLRASRVPHVAGDSVATSPQGRCGCACATTVVVGGRGRGRRMHGRLLLRSGRRGRARRPVGGFGRTGMMRRRGLSKGSATQVNGPGLPRVTPPAGQADRMAVKRSILPAGAGTTASAVRCGRAGEVSLSCPGVGHLYVGRTAVAQSPGACSAIAEPSNRRHTVAPTPAGCPLTDASLLGHPAGDRPSLAPRDAVREPVGCPALVEPSP